MGSNPVTLPAALTAAATATINVLAMVLHWSTELVGGLNLAASAWIIVGSFWIRTKVAPEANIRAVSPATADTLFSKPS